MKINFEEIIRNLEGKANSIYMDNEKLRNLIKNVKNTVENNKELKKIMEEIRLLLELIKDWIKGDYKQVSRTSLIMIIISFIYLLNPLDLIPDFIVGGFLDDIAVITYVVKKIQEELKVYKEWRNREEGQVIIEVQGEVMDMEEQGNMVIL